MGGAGAVPGSLRPVGGTVPLASFGSPPPTSVMLQEHVCHTGFLSLPA